MIVCFSFRVNLVSPISILRENIDRWGFSPQWLCVTSYPSTNRLDPAEGVGPTSHCNTRITIEASFLWLLIWHELMQRHTLQHLSPTPQRYRLAALWREGRILSVRVNPPSESMYQYHLTKCGTFQMWATTYLTLERGITPLCLLNIDGNTDSRAVIEGPLFTLRQWK